MTAMLLGALRLALSAITRNKMRAALTALGATITDNGQYDRGAADPAPSWHVSPGRPEAGASVDVGNGHRITSDFPDIRISPGEGSQWGPRTLTAEGRLNGGGPVLKVHTSSGDICFKRAQ